MTTYQWFQFFMGVVIAAPTSATIWPALAQEPTHSRRSAQDAIVEIGVETEHTQAENTSAARALAFSCQMENGIPVTVVQTSGATIQIVRWDERALAIATTPQADCEHSAAQFQTSHDDDLLTYITTGRMNGQLVACAADRVSGRCLSRLLRLQPTQRPRMALQQVLQIRLPTEGPISDTGLRPYVDINRYLSGGYTRNTH